MRSWIAWRKRRQTLRVVAGDAGDENEPVGSDFNLLTEDGDNLITEDGNYLVTEDAA